MTRRQRVRTPTLEESQLKIRAEETAAQYANEVVRAGAHAGLSILESMEKELIDAWRRYNSFVSTGDQEKGTMARGRIRGIASMIALVRNPYSYDKMGATSASWLRVIKKVEDEARQKLVRRVKTG